MGIFENTSLDPDSDLTTEVWDSTIAEIKFRGLEIHGSLSKRNVDDGATAVVLKATESKSGRIVAIKIYKDPDRQVEHRNGDTVSMMNFFENERRMLASLQACELVPKYYFSVAMDEAATGMEIQPFHVMEFIEGQRITKFALASVGSDKQALIHLFQQVLGAIETIHQFGYLHRDLSDGNILVDPEGNIRLIDLAEASPLGEEHTRLVSTPGFGTEGVATPEQRHIRKIQTDDVRDACTIGYAMFTGQWKQDGESLSDWRRNLLKAGTPKRIAHIIAKGMKPRDPNRKQDRSVWNTAREVNEAIERHLRQANFRKKLIVNALGLLAIAATIMLMAYWAWVSSQQYAYTAELKRLSEHRNTLSNTPRESRADPRVQKRIKKAQELEEQAELASAKHDPTGATALVTKAVDEIAEATRTADNIARLRPLVEPLRKILLENNQWNRDCQFINQQLTDLGEDYQDVQRQVESGDPDSAWTLFAALQPKLVELIDDNQKSLEIVELITQAQAQSVGLATALQALTAFQQIKHDCSRAATHYSQGKWPEARTELLGAMASLTTFLEKHETTEQRKNRLASNAEVVSAQMAANDALQRQVAELTQQMADAKAEYQDVLFKGAQFQKERDMAQSHLATLRDELKTMKSDLQAKTAELSSAESEQERLTKLHREDEKQLASYVQRLADGTTIWEQQADKLKNVRAELKRTKNVLAKLSDASNVDPAAAKRQLELAEAEQAIKSFDPKSLQEADKRLASESQQYEKLLAERKKEIAIGKTSRHADVKAIDDRLKSQFDIVISSLKKRDELDLQAWESLQTQIDHQHLRREATIEEGWATTSSKVHEIEEKIAILKNEQDPHNTGNTRFTTLAYEYKDWLALKSVPKVRFAAARSAYGELKPGKKITNSIGQEFVYIPPGTFQMGSPKNEANRYSDETLHTVTLTDGFFVAATETTQGAYETVTGEQPWKGKSSVREGANYPAVYVSWQDATEKFVKQLNDLERKNGNLPSGWEYRLLTEAQWEYTARAGSKTAYCFGDDVSKLRDYAWFDDNAWDIGEKYAHRVAQKRPNRWGLFDMHGNTWEWVADNYGKYAEDAVSNPSGPNTGVVRGGCWFSNAGTVRSAFRRAFRRGLRYYVVGFRCARVQVKPPDQKRSLE